MGHYDLVVVGGGIAGLCCCKTSTWTREPYGAAGHLWRLGVEPWNVSAKLEAFSLTGRAPENVHICGEAFSDFQESLEGALRSTHRALTKALG